MTKSDWYVNELIGTQCVPLRAINRCVAPLQFPGHENIPPHFGKCYTIHLQDCVENQPSSGIRDGRGEVLKLISVLFHMQLPHILEKQRGSVLFVGEGFARGERKLNSV